MKSSHLRAAALAVLLVVSAGIVANAAASLPAEFPPDAFPSTYQPLPSQTTLIQHATIYTGTGERIDDGSVLLRDGKVAAVGKNIEAPAGAVVIDARGKYVMPGLIDVHSHLGVYPSPAVEATANGNEMTNPTTPQVMAEHSVWPQDPGFNTARAGGVTTLEILPGSGNLIGGRSVVLKNVPATTVQGMKFPDAPYGLKMACGENPMRVYGSRHQFPSTLMGDVAGYRQAFADAQAYDREWKAWEAKVKAKGAVDAGPPPKRDLGKETLAEVLDGKIRVQMHCYRADEMAALLDVAHEFGFGIAAFHHAVEAYKIPHLLAKADTCAAMWADWWGFKMEAWDGIRANIAMVDAGGACAMIHSDDQNGIQRLNQEVAKALAAGRRAGLDISKEHAVMWMTLNPAKALGLADRIGSLEPGKDADVVIWSADPFSVYARTEKVFLDGAVVFDRDDPKRQSTSDFMLGSSIDPHAADAAAAGEGAR
ncbi:amidohydrolase [Rhodanobacter denitrificans]|uniref:Amidohydrolase n=1 Tax=Rhodanobacter denitrificans TaxID=666685 RepID=A0A368KE30_9GAMM|nr:amidohydrolase [Rhodanobacter denitrificans]RCS30164.1 amidohydrolase [Rhodanobacter denitrificans]